MKHIVRHIHGIVEVEADDFGVDDNNILRLWHEQKTVAMFNRWTYVEAKHVKKT
jgi:hypothetical protein